MTTSEIHVLLVEDNPGDAVLVTEALSEAPGATYIVHAARTLDHAIQLAGREPCDVVLLDLSLPDSLGLDTLTRFKADWPSLPVIVLTGFDDDRLGMESLQRDAQDYIVKDEATPRRLGRAIRFAIERTQATQQVQRWRERYTLWIQQSADGLWDWELATGAITYSPGWKAMLGFEPHELANSAEEWFDRVIDEDASPLADGLQAAIQSGESTFSLDYRIRNKSGRIRWMRARGMIVRDAAQQPIRIAGSQDDVTEEVTNPCGDCGRENLITASLCAHCGGRVESAMPSRSTVNHAGGADLPHGTLLAERYRIEDLIDVGAAGAVYVATDEKEGARVAVKVLHSWLLDTPHARERFTEEGRIQIKVNHPNVVQILDVGAENGRDFLVMELVSGPTLREFMVSSDCPQDPRVLVELFLPLIDGISAVHASGVIHRDIKPENILVVHTADGFAFKITDFGVAKAQTNHTKRTHVGAVIGTLQYMAPEQFVDAGDADIRADIYALGCNLFELLTRRPPFNYESEFRMMTAHLTEVAENPRTYNPLISKPLGDAILVALGKEPELRYSDCASLKSALREALRP